MDIPFQKRMVAAPLSLLVGLSVAFCTLFATNAAAEETEKGGPPPAGFICREDGGINGRGSTYMNLIQHETFIKAAQEACGLKPVEYNYTNAVEHSLTGSGAGNKAASCRSDAFAGTDIPYSVAQLEQLDGAPGSLLSTAAGHTTETVKQTGECEPTGFEPPFGPKPAPYPDETAGQNDKEARVMALPIGGSALALGVNLVGADCTSGVAPTELKFTKEEVSRLYGGEVKAWNDAQIDETDPELVTDGCTGAIKRVVREDTSGTTNIFKVSLARFDNERTHKGEVATCGSLVEAGKQVHTWEFYNGGGTGSPNTNWPNSAEGGECTEVLHGEKSGNPELIKKLKETPNAVGYADLAEMQGQGVTIAKVENAAGTTFQSPISGTHANCKYSEDTTLPEGGTPTGAVGLGEHEGWAVNASPNHDNTEDRGKAYPMCGLTFALVYEGLGRDVSEAEEHETAITRLNADQRRTLWWYFEDVVLNPIVQERVSFYSPLPLSWLSAEAKGFNEWFRAPNK